MSIHLICRHYRTVKDLDHAIIRSAGEMLTFVIGWYFMGRLYPSGWALLYISAPSSPSSSAHFQSPTPFLVAFSIPRRGLSGSRAVRLCQRKRHTTTTMPVIPNSLKPRDGSKDWKSTVMVSQDQLGTKEKICALFGNIYFTAKWPPRMLLFAVREGGLSKSVLCSEICSVNEHHKVMVLRKPPGVAAVTSIVQ